MKIRAVVTCFLASVIITQMAFADEPECFWIDGYVQIFPSDEDTCPLVTENGDRFDADFLFNKFGNPGGYNATCFSGQLSNTIITIDNNIEIPVKGSSESALLLGFPASVPNAASAIKIKSPKLFKGKIFTIDTISFIPGEEGEFLEVTSGNRAYKEAVPYNIEVEESSFITINGSAFAGAEFQGQICLE